MTTASTRGLRPVCNNVARLGLVPLAFVSSFEAVGTLLVFGLLVGPPATGALLVRRVWLCMVVAVVLGWLSVGVGLVLSYHHGTAAGATMAGVSVALFFVVLAAQELIAALRLRTPPPATCATPPHPTQTPHRTPHHQPPPHQTRPRPHPP